MMEGNLYLRSHSSSTPDMPKRVQRLVRKLIKEIEVLPVDQQRTELAKIGSFRYIIKPKVKKHRSKRLHKIDRHERPQEPSFVPEDLQVPASALDRYKWVNPNKTTDKFKEKVWLVDGEYQVFRTWLVPDPFYLRTYKDELYCCCDVCCGYGY